MRTFTIAVFFVCALIVAGPAAQEQVSDTNSDEPEIIRLINGQRAISWKDQVYGPHHFVIIHGVYEDQLAYSARDEEWQWSVYWGDVHYGPFQELVVKGVYQDKLLFYYYEDGKYHVRWGEKAKGRFQSVSKLHYGSDGLVHFIGRAGNITANVHWDGS